MTAPGTKPRRQSRRQRTRAGALSYRQTQQANRAAAQAIERRWQTLARAPHANHDPTRIRPAQIRTRLVREVADVIDADPGLVNWVEALIVASYIRPGRPREFEVRTALICFVLLIVTHQNFHLVHLPELLGQMTWRVRRHLGIDYLEAQGRPKQISYEQLVNVFHKIAEVFDAWDDNLNDTDKYPDRDLVARIRADRASNLQQFVDRLTAASTNVAPMWSGNAAIDATMKWSHERPPGTKANSKVERRGRDGDAGPAVPLSDVVDQDTIDPTIFETSDPNLRLDHNSTAPAQTAKKTKKPAGRTRRPKNWPSTWSLGSAWAGRANKSKSVHGFAIHTVVRSDGPCLVESFTVTPANGNPGEAAMPLLRRIHDRRANDDAVIAAIAVGDAHLIGDVVADPAYSMAKGWQREIKALTGAPVFRPHRNNQEGIRIHPIGRGTRAGQIHILNGHPVCECLSHTPLADLRYPKFPYTSEQLNTYQAEVAKINSYEWKPHGRPLPGGKQQWNAPHHTGPDGKSGGCPHCITNSGEARQLNDLPVARCCQAKSRLVPAELLELDQGVTFGTPEWAQRWNVRNRVEGSYGVLKNLAVTNVCRAAHTFVGLARETLVASFQVVAYNMHMLRQWRTRQQLIAPIEIDLPSAEPTTTVPVDPDTTTSAAAKRRGPAGLEFLGSSRAGP